MSEHSKTRGFAVGEAPPEARAERLAAYEQRRREALAARRDLIIHREAIGLRRPEPVLRLYPIPERRR